MEHVLLSFMFNNGRVVGGGRWERWEVRSGRRGAGSGWRAVAGEQRVVVGGCLVVRVKIKTQV